MLALSRPLTALALAMILGAACTRQASAIDGGPERQVLVITGSSTMAPLISDIAARFQHEPNVNVQILVTTGGSTKGVSDARLGTANIAMVSRALSTTENDMRGFPVARDGICLILHRDNPVHSLRTDQVTAIYNGKTVNWKEVGGRDALIHVLTRSAGRSEVEPFLAYFKLAAGAIKAAAVGETPDAIQSVLDDPDAVNFVSVGAAEFKAKQGAPIQLLATGSVAASSTTIRSGDYPLARPLMLVTRGTPTGVAKELIEYSLSPKVMDLVQERDFVPYFD